MVTQRILPNICRPSPYRSLRPGLAANHPTIESTTHELEHQGWNGICIEP